MLTSIQVGVGDTAIIYILGHGYVTIDDQLYIVCSGTDFFNAQTIRMSGMTCSIGQSFSNLFPSH
jgi:hypothetical protein